MFYERPDNHMLEPRMGFLIDGSYEDMYTSTALKEDHWQKVQNLLPTPPCSPEELCYQAGFPEFMPPAAAQSNFQQGLQVVPDEIPNDLVDTNVDSLPILDISDEEMQKLTSPTIFDDTMWPMHSSQQPTPQCEVYDNRPTTVSDVNYISHGIRTVHISDQVVRSPAYSQSFVLTVNANPIQPLNTMGHLITREILATPTNSGMISGKITTRFFSLSIAFTPKFLPGKSRLRSVYTHMLYIVIYLVCKYTKFCKCIPIFSSVSVHVVNKLLASVACMARAWPRVRS